MAVGAFDVPFGITGGPDADVTAAFDEADQVYSVGEPAGRRSERLFPNGRIAAKAKNIVDAQRLGLIENVGEHLFGRTDAGKMGHRLDAEIAANALNDPQRGISSAAAGAVGDGEKPRPEQLQGRHHIAEEGCFRGGVLGREKLERDIGSGEREQFADFQASSPPLAYPVLQSVFPYWVRRCIVARLHHTPTGLQCVQ